MTTGIKPPQWHIHLFVLLIGKNYSYLSSSTCSLSWLGWSHCGPDGSKTHWEVIRCQSEPLHHKRGSWNPRETYLENFRNLPEGAIALSLTLGRKIVCTIGHAILGFHVNLCWDMRPRSNIILASCQNMSRTKIRPHFIWQQVTYDQFQSIGLAIDNPWFRIGRANEIAELETCKIWVA